MAKSLFARLRADALRTAQCSDHPLHPVLAKDEFARLLTRERARVDRAGGQFAVLTFSARSVRHSGELFTALAEILQSRLRETDDVGWLSADSLGVLLPATPTEGAWKVADDVCLRFTTAETPPLCTVYCYPSEQDPTDDNPSAKHPVGVDHNRLERNGVEQHDVELSSASRSASRSTGRQRSAHALEPLLARRLPLWKRGMDLLGAATGIVFLSPLLLPIMLAIKLTSPGPVFFKQWRSGLGGRPFLIFKFRTMEMAAEAKKAALREQSEQDGPAFKMTNDPRITRIGKLLRATSIDELPQLWNVLRGEMSLVGPRPLPCDETAACELWQRQRLDVMPGLTCIWQVRGRSVVTFNEWVRMDVEYIRSQSPWTDVKLIAQTIPAMVLRKGV